MEIEITVPGGRIGLWEIQTFSLNPLQAEAYNIFEFPAGKRYIDGNKPYKRLLRYESLEHSFGELVMSNTPAEVEDHRLFIEHASGDVLIFGLGLGMAVQALIAKPRVTIITVIEISPDVIALCGLTMQHSLLK